jgi:hypothetical protein
VGTSLEVLIIMLGRPVIRVRRSTGVPIRNYCRLLIAVVGLWLANNQLPGNPSDDLYICSTCRSLDRARTAKDANCLSRHGNMRLAKEGEVGIVRCREDAHCQFERKVTLTRADVRRKTRLTVECPKHRGIL